MSRKMVSKAITSANVRRQALAATGDLHRTTFIEKLKKNPKSLRMSINAMCWTCQCGPATVGEITGNPHPRWLIGNCEIPSCSLWNVRPFQVHQGRPPPWGVVPRGACS